jgi:Tfp pilus assembly PilM family ATPase
MNLFNRPKLYLDFQDSIIRVVQGNLNGNKVRVDGFASLELTKSLSFRQDEAENRELGAVLTDFLKVHGLSASRALVNLNQEGIIIRTAVVPAMKTKVLTEFLHKEINEFLPVDLNEYNYDYRIIRMYQDESDNQQYFELLLAAVPRNTIQRIVHILEETDLYISAIDILPNSLLRLFSQATYNEGIAVLEVGDDGTRIMAVRGQIPLFYADIPFRLSNEEQDFVQLFEETRGYLNYFASRHQGRQVEGVFVLGKLAQSDRAIRQIFQEVWGVPVMTQVDDLVQLEYQGKMGSQFAKVAAMYAANLGLMLRKDGH